MFQSSPFRNAAIATLTIVSFISFAGCNSEPDLHPIRGKVTLGGQPRERIIVYFDPVDRKVDEFRLGVGHTDADGTLVLRSTAGDGLAAGEYRVSFSFETYGDVSDEAPPTDDKGDDEGYEPPELVQHVPDKYLRHGESPVLFTIKEGENRYEFDIPAK